MPRGIVTLKSGVARVCVELDAMGGGVVDSKSGEVRPCAELDAMTRPCAATSIEARERRGI